MKSSEVQVGNVYFAKVSGGRVLVRVETVTSHGGYTCRNLYTGRAIHARSARRFSVASPEQQARLAKFCK